MAGLFKLDLDDDLFSQLAIIIFFGFRWWNIPDGRQQAVMVEPRYPFQRGQFDRRFGFPGPSTVNHLGLV